TKPPAVASALPSSTRPPTWLAPSRTTHPPTWSRSPACPTAPPPPPSSRAPAWPSGADRLLARHRHCAPRPPRAPRRARGAGRPGGKDELGGRGERRRAPLGRTTPRRRLTPTSVWFRGCAMRPPTAPSLRPPARSCRSVLVTHPTGDVGLSSPWIEPIDHG